MAIEATHGHIVPEIVIHRGMRLAAARQHAGMSQEQMGELLGCSRRTVSRYEADETSAPPAVVIAYSVTTDVNLGWLQTGTPKGPTPKLTLVPDGASDSGRLRESNSRPIHYMTPSSTRIAA